MSLYIWFIKIGRIKTQKMYLWCERWYVGTFKHLHLYHWFGYILVSKRQYLKLHWLVGGCHWIQCQIYLCRIVYLDSNLICWFLVFLVYTLLSNILERDVLSDVSWQVQAIHISHFYEMEICLDLNQYHYQSSLQPKHIIIYPAISKYQLSSLAQVPNSSLSFVIVKCFFSPFFFTTSHLFASISM